MVLKSFVRAVEKTAYHSILFYDAPYQINIPTDVFESNVPIVQNSMCTEDEKEEYGFLLGEKG